MAELMSTDLIRQVLPVLPKAESKKVECARRLLLASKATDACASISSLQRLA
jgi:hypothetical protein